MTTSLLIAHYEQPFLTRVDASTLQSTHTLPMPGRVAVLGASGHKRYGFAVHRDDHCVTIVQPDGTLSTIATDQQPTHFHTHEAQIVIFNDGTGSVSVFDENAIDQPPVMLKATQPDHGSAVILGDYLLAGHLRLGRVDVYPIGQPDILVSFENCPALHGAAQVGDLALFGASDGVLLVKKQGDHFTSVKLDNPVRSRARVGLFAVHPCSHLTIGNYGEGFAVIDSDAERMITHTLPAHPLKFTFDEAGETLLILATDGVLYRIKPETGECVSSLALVTPVEPPKGPDGKPRPTFTLSEGSLYAISPQDEQLIVVDLASMTIARRVPCAPQPSMITALISS